MRRISAFFLLYAIIGVVLAALLVSLCALLKYIYNEWVQGVPLIDNVASIFTLYNTNPFVGSVVSDLLAATLFATFTWCAWELYRDRRRNSLGRILLRNHYRLIAWNFSIRQHVYRDILPQKFSSTKAIRPTQEASVSQNFYRAYIHAMISANESAKRAIDINDAVISDAFLKLESDEIDLLFLNSNYAYEITTMFDYMLERLGHFNLHRHAYDFSPENPFDEQEAAHVINSLNEDLHSANFLREAFEFKKSAARILTSLGAKKRQIDKLMDDRKIASAIKHNHNSREFDAFNDLKPNEISFRTGFHFK